MENQSTPQPQSYWAIIELFGHQRVAGFVTERLFGSEMMFQVDVPALITETCEEDIEAFSQFINPKAIYRLSLVSELLARAAVQAISLKPVHVFNAAKDIKMILKGNPALKPAWEEEE